MFIWIYKNKYKKNVSVVAYVPGIRGTQPSRGIDFWKSCAHHSAPTKGKMSYQYHQPYDFK